MLVTRVSPRGNVPLGALINFGLLPRRFRPTLHYVPRPATNPIERMSATPQIGTQALAAALGPRSIPANTGTYAALDLGTNNCRLLIAVPAQNGFRVVDSFSRIVRLGEGLAASGTLAEPAMLRAIDALRTCRQRLSRRPIRAVRAVATEACRRASNGRAFLDRVLGETGLHFDTITPREEAQLALDSCVPLLDPLARRALLFDIGGGSTELVWVRLGGTQPDIIGYDSLPIGVVSLAERYGSDVFTNDGYDAMVDDIRARLAPFERVHRIAQETRAGGVQALGTSGTVTTLAGIALKLSHYRRPLVDGVELASGTAAAAVSALRAMGLDGLRAHPCVGPERAEFVLPGCAVFEAIQQTWALPQVTVADRGLREGMLTRLMREAPPARRSQATSWPATALTLTT